VPIVRNVWSLNLLEPSGSVQGFLYLCYIAILLLPPHYFALPPFQFSFQWQIYYDVIMKIYVLLTKYYSGVQIEKNETGGACSTCGGEERCIQGFGGET